jgi:phosphoribosylglycinamide formyltransferase-1
MKTRIAIFASGSGSNAENIARHFIGSDKVQICMILTNNQNAGVIRRAADLDLPCHVFDRDDFYKSRKVIDLLREKKINYLVLAGFLWLVPAELIEFYMNRIINIHPALLPAHGGKGFYGAKVHQSVIASGSIISGITIHHVNEKFDEGTIIFQAACHVGRKDDEYSLAQKIHQLEYKYFPVVLEKIIID